jgi:two-component system osmolarity sensor histidine kinase EnvZ
MANPAGAEGRPSDPFSPWVRYGLAGLALAAASLVQLQLLVGRRLVEQRQRQLGAEVAAHLLLGEVALERFTPATLARISGLRLVVGPWPEARAGGPRQRAPSPAAGPLVAPARQLRLDLCARLGRCPLVLPAGRGSPGVWVAMESPLESVWLFVPLPPVAGWPPDPLLLSLALGIGGLGAGLLFLSLEVQRPLRRLERAMAQVGLESDGAWPLAPEGSPAVRRLTLRFNTMVQRLEHAARERATMLAGIAHDLRSPLTRLRLRLDQTAVRAGLPEEERRRGGADLDALERITGQFLLFAGAERSEPVVSVPLAELVAEVAALAGSLPLELDLPPLQCRVRPTALARAVANLLENAIGHGEPPLKLVLRPLAGPPQGGGFVVEVWDGGPGIPSGAWQEALEPFQRLDPARGGPGRCGLGLAIAERIARDHGGGLRRLERPGAFGVALEGRCLPADGELSAAWAVRGSGAPVCPGGRPVTSSHGLGWLRSWCRKVWASR